LKLFEEIVKEQPGTSSCWEVYLKFLQENSMKDKLREVFQRALEACRDPNEIISKFIEWETRGEDLTSLIQCKVLCQKRKMRDVEVLTVKNEKFKMKSLEKNARFTAFIHNLPGNVKEYQLDEVLRQVVKVKAVRIVRDRKGNSRGIAYCDFESQEDLDYAVSSLNQRELCGNKVHVAVSRPPELEKNEEKTVFVNNLPFSCTEELLKTTFSPFVDVFQVRVIKNSEGRCKGYAYVVFSEKSSADLAIGRSDLSLEGRRVTVEKYQENKEQKFVLHVSNLPFDVTEKDLAQLFPTSASVSCPLDRNGKTRGFGFVEFSVESQANDVLEMSAPMLGGRYVVVKRSYKKAQEKKLDNKDFKKFL
jgi:RNA recognition motif-containing protein